MTPSLPALRAFDAAAQHGSFRAAAEKLLVTPTAISHHIRGLEEQFGVKLFDRVGRDVVLTETGKRLAEATLQAFGTLDEAILALGRSSRKVVRLVGGPFFAARWLMPKMGDFWEAHPDIELEVIPSYYPGAHDRQNADISIRWDRMSEMPSNAKKLLELSPVAIASADFIEKSGPITSPQTLLDLPLLHQRNHWGWLDWFVAMGTSVDTSLRGPVFEDANVLLRGAAQSQGAIVGWLPLIDQDLAEGRVMRLFDEKIAPTHGYFIEVGKSGDLRRETRKVAKWLLQQNTDAKIAP